MSVLVPRCYTQFLSSLSQLTPSLSYWPRARVTSGTITSWDTCANKTGERMLTSSEARLYTMTGRSVCPAREIDKIWILTSGEDTLKHILESFVMTNIIDLSSEDAHNVLTHLETNGFQDRIIRQDNIHQICLENLTVINSMDREERLFLLDYIVSGGGCVGGLPLLPLRNGTWSTLKRNDERRYYFSKDPHLPAAIPETFDRITAFEDEVKFTEITELQAYGILNLEKNLAEVIEDSYPASALMTSALPGLREIRCILLKKTCPSFGNI